MAAKKDFLNNPKNFLFLVSAVALFLVIYLLNSDWLSLDLGSRAGYVPQPRRTLPPATPKPAPTPNIKPVVPPSYR